MAHIASCMLNDAAAGQDKTKCASTLNLNYFIAKSASPLPLVNDQDRLEHPSPATAEKSFVWRMYQPERKYQLFPKEKQQLPSGKGMDPGQAFAHAMGCQGQAGEKTEKSSLGSGLRLRIKEHNLNRRRKVSVPELGPMTTVQEVPMDSPTIPGRPPLHERSISAPGNSWRHHHLAEVMICHSPILVGTPELTNSSGSTDTRSTTATSNSTAPSILPESRLPLSPKTLAPLVIPTTQGSTAPKLTRQLSLSQLRSGSTPIEGGARSARTDDSPKSRTPYTPLSANTALTTPKSATTAMTVSALTTPVSAPIECRSSSQPWGEPSSNQTLCTTPKETFLDLSVTPKAESEARPSISHNIHGHRRNQSESGSIMERGRPRKRSDIVGGNVSLGRSLSKRSKSAERRAFENLPKGFKSSEAINALSQIEAAALQKQALEQAARFEILRKEDVENLSRELRQLDERTEYLRRTYNSLRAGRRNLHSRICQYLRSPRVAKFSHESMLKQEEALAELDSSIDDWVNKLEQAENRRTRVRQKLLEHVAAAATMSLNPAMQGVSESLHLAMGIRSPPALPGTGAGNISTPPRSPTKASYSSSHVGHTGSPSPQRFGAQVPSTILEQPLGEEMEGLGLRLRSNSNGKEEEAAEALRRAAVESIRIYAGDDVYALLADVEKEITKMGNKEGNRAAQQEADAKEANLSEEERKEIHRARSHELLNGVTKKSSASSMSSNCNKQQQQQQQAAPQPSSPTRSTAAATKLPTPLANDGEIFLTSAVFKP